MGNQAFLNDKQVKYVLSNVKIHLNLDMKAQNLYKTAYFSS